jgi:hypothetical protein
MSCQREIKYICIYRLGRVEDNIGAKEVDRIDRANGCLKIACHFVIKRNGLVELGRPLAQPGCFNRQYNTRGVGVCLVAGEYEESLPEPQQLAIERVIKLIREMNPEAEVVYL